jgi:O-antigen/teichoic acid export membrane protein
MTIADPSEGLGRPGGGGLAHRARQSLVASAVSTAAMVLAGVIVARVLGPSGRGEYAVGSIVGVIAGTALVMGVDVWAGRALAQTRDGRSVARVLRWQALIAVAGSAAVGSAATLVTGEAPFGVAVALTTLGTSELIVALAALVAVQRMGLYFGGLATASLGFLAAMIVLAQLDVRSVPIALATFGITRLAGSLFLLVALRHQPQGSGQATLREAVSFGAPAAIGSIATLVAYRADVVVLAALAPTADVGLYAAAAAMTEGLWLIPDALASVLLPHVARSADTHEATARVVRLSSEVLLGGFVGLTLFGGPLVRLVFGSEYSSAADALPALALAAVSLGAWKLLIADLGGRGDTRVRAFSATAGLGAMIAADFLMIPRWGIVGAAYAALLGYSVAALWAGRRWSAATGQPPSRLWIPKVSDLDVLRTALDPRASRR